MKISEKTRLAEIAEVMQFFTEDSVKTLKEQAEDLFGKCWNLTFADFFACAEKDFSCIGADVNHPEEMTALQYYWIERFKDFAEEFTNAVEQLSTPSTNEAKMAAKSCLPMTFQEGVIVSCREYFGLHSFDEVYGIKVSDFVIMRKDLYNKAVFEQAIQRINESKYKK